MTDAGESAGPQEMVVAQVRLPISVTELTGIAQMLVQDHGAALRMRQEDDRAVFFLPGGQASLTEAQIRARELYRFADHLDGGTPRAWAFHHPCDPPGTPWEPDVSQRTLMQAADAAREEARRILGEENR